MTMNDPLSNVLSNLYNCERVGKKECVVKPASEVINAVLAIMRDKGYIGEVKVVESGRGNLIEVNLLGRINKCGVIKPRFSFKKGDVEKYEKRYLPAKNFGIMIVSTPKGFMTHTESKEKGFGGRLISYVY